MQISRNVYIDKLDDIVDVKPSICIDFGIKNNAKDPKFKVADHLRISKYKNILQKFTFQIGVKKFSWLKRLKTLFCF